MRSPLYYAVSCIIGLLMCTSGAMSQAVSIPMTPPAKDDMYVWITQLRAGPISYSGVPDTDVIGHFYRAVVTTTEIYSDLFVERLTMGEEGFGKVLRWTRQMDAEAFARAFRIRGEFAGLMVERWLDPETFVVSIQGREFAATVKSEDELLVKEMKTPK